MSDLTLRAEVFRTIAVSSGKPPTVRLPREKLGTALRCAGLFPTESFLISVPEDGLTPEGFSKLLVPDLSMSFSEALHLFDVEQEGTFHLEHLMFALKGTGEPLPDELADEIIEIAMSSRTDDDRQVVNIDTFVHALNIHFSTH